MMRVSWCAVAAVVGVMSLGGAALGQGSLTTVAVSVNNSQYSWSLSHDGGVLTGNKWNNRYWSAAEGVVAVPGGYAFDGVSGDGSTLVGSMGSNNAVAMWRETQTIRGQRFGDRATGASADGTAISIYAPRAVWNPDTNVSVALQPNGTMFVATVSADGRYAVGEEATLLGHAARWDAATGAVTGLGRYRPAGGPNDLNVWARAVSADGRVIVGYVAGATAPAPRWVEGRGWESLGWIPDAPHGASHSWGVSADGTRIVGESAGRAFFWTEEEGMRDLGVVLAEHGVEVDGWSFTSAKAISGDGYTIAGFATRAGVGTRVFIATIPGPGTVAAGVGVLGVACRRRRR